MNPEKIINTLRKDKSKSLKRRRKLAILSSIGLFDFTIISLFQLGVIRHLPDVPGKLFDSDSVNSSPKAYALGFPDGPLSALIYAAILILIGYKGDKKSGRPGWANWALFLLVTGHAAGAADYLKDMIRQKKICPYCLVGTIINFASLPLAYGEIRKDCNC